MPRYGFLLNEVRVNSVQLIAVGHETREGTYSLNGLTRKDRNKTVFQYTLGGEGCIRLEGVTYSVKQGQAFFVSVPSDHCYFIPKSSDYWDCLFISLGGPEADACCTYFHNAFGPVAAFSEHSSVIKVLRHIYKEADQRRITNGYMASGLAYRFLMEIYQHQKHAIEQDHSYPEIVQAKALLSEYYDEIAGLEELAERLQVSKYRLAKLFKKTTQCTVVQYLTKIRLRKAMELLQESDLSIEEIAVTVGFANGNYFRRVFNSAAGITPSEFRSRNKALSIVHTTFL